MERYFNVAKPRPARTGTALETFERQVLFFPLVVVVLACASFLFGGRCAAWQWWTAIAAVVASPFTTDLVPCVNQLARLKALRGECNEAIWQWEKTVRSCGATRDILGNLMPQFKVNDET